MNTKKVKLLCLSLILVSLTACTGQKTNAVTWQNTTTTTKFDEAITETETTRMTETVPVESVEILATTATGIQTAITTESQTVTETTTEESTEPITEPPVTVSNLKVGTISVSCLKVTWDAESDRAYDVNVNTEAPYQENIYFCFKEDGLLYLTGLRENSEYYITVTPVVSEGETAQSETIIGHTETVEVVYNFDEDEEAYNQYKDSGILYSTNFFAGEKASGLTAQPASGAIAGSINDPITDTGICRDEYGDYCVAMGQFFGNDWDRYLITFQNGQQITVKQCDDKGLKWYHTVGGDDNNRNIIEFIWYGAKAPSGVMYTGTWGAFTWNGLTFDHIQSIQKINYPDNPVEY